MAASWPSAKKTFSQVVNGITKLVALLFNTNYDETEAIQTFIGASGETQAKNAALINLFRDMLSPVPEISYIDADTIEIEAKTITMFNGNDYVIKRNTSAIQITLSGNLDTGSEAASTWYYIYLTGDGSSTTYSAAFSASASSPTGYTYYKLIGKVYNDGSSNISATQMWSVGIDTPLDATVKAWVQFDKTGTIQDSYNVAGITDSGSGDFTVTWDTDFANDDYAVVATADSNRSASHDNIAVGTCDINTYDTNTGNISDPSNYICVIAIGDQ